MTKPTNFKTWAYPAYNHYDMPLTLKRLEFLAMLYRMAKEGDIYPEIQDIKERCNLECGVYSINANGMLKEISRYGGVTITVHHDRKHYMLNKDNLKHMLVAARSFISFVDEALEDD